MQPRSRSLLRITTTLLRVAVFPRSRWLGCHCLRRSGSYSDSGQTLSDGDATAIADLDSDGDNDIVIAGRGGSTSRIWLNNGSGVFTDSGQGLAGDAYGMSVTSSSDCTAQPTLFG